MSLLWSANGAFPSRTLHFIENIPLGASYFYFTKNFEKNEQRNMISLMNNGSISACLK